MGRRGLDGLDWSQDQPEHPLVWKRDLSKAYHIAMTKPVQPGNPLTPKSVKLLTFLYILDFTLQTPVQISAGKFLS